MATLRPLSNLRGLYTIDLKLTPSAVAANTTAEQTFNLPGVKAVDMLVAVTKPTQQAGLGIVNMRVTADSTIGIAFSNNTGSPITPTAGETYVLMVAQVNIANEPGFVPNTVQ